MSRTWTTCSLPGWPVYGKFADMHKMTEGEKEKGSRGVEGLIGDQVSLDSPQIATAGETQ